MNPELTELTARLERAEQDLHQAKAEMTQAARRSRRQGLLMFVAVVGMGLLTFCPLALAQTPGVTLASLLTRIVALETKTAALTQTGTPGTDGALLQVKGDNVQIVDGIGSTDAINGLGNLIIGYNDTRGQDSGAGTDIRTGSHNLIVGDLDNYSSYGAIVCGFQNAGLGPYASVAGGARNTASGQAASVSGGQYNTANGTGSSVSGGISNTASNRESWVGGGSGNTTNSFASSVTGGNGVSQSSDYGWAAGGTGSGAYHSP